MDNRPSFFAELKRRNVYKVAAAYAVVAWLLIQGASIVLPTFEAPSWTMKVQLIVLAIGFPGAVIFAWAFEITPEGIKLESEVKPGRVDNKTYRPETSRDNCCPGRDCCQFAGLSTFTKQGRG
jgi:hypothetical protein